MILFITGTDTGVGKTAVAAGLAQLLLGEGRTVSYYKPLQTGLEEGEHGDADFVAAAAHVPTLEGQRFPAPLAPAVAAAQAGKAIDWPQLIETGEAAAAEVDVLLVEGAGGLLVPIQGELTMADLAGALEADSLVVSRPSLGTLNHTALTVEAIRARGLPISGLMISGWPARPGILESTNLALLEEMAPVRGILAHLEGLDTARPETVQFTWQHVQKDWLRSVGASPAS